MARLKLLVAWLLLLPSVLAALTIFVPATVAASTPAYNASYLISDSIFANSSSMSVNAIQGFLVSENSGLKNYSDVENCNPTTPTLPDPYASSYYQHCGSRQSAAQIIYDAGQAYGINPQAIMATLEKEQSLITTPNPTASQINCAMGYASCSGFVGFFNQVDNGTWQLRTYIQLMTGNSWWGYSPASYPCAHATSLYSAGLYPGATVRFTDPGGTAETVTLNNAATAALYCYTPYVGPFNVTGYSGSYNFVTYFEDWFGPNASPCYNDSNISGQPTSASIIGYNYNSGPVTNYALLLQNNTGSDCVELHGLNAPGAQAWYNHVATAMKSTDSSQGEILAYRPKAGSGDTLLYVNYGSGTSNVNVHEFSPDLTEMPGYYDAGTNLGSMSPSQGTFVSGDFLGRGYDQLAFVLYNGSTGHVEVHLFSPNLTQGVGYDDIVTNLGSVPAGSGTFVSGDFLGRGYDQLAFVLYNGSTGHVEVHLFSPNLTQGVGYDDIVTDLNGVDSSDATFTAGHFLGNPKVDQLALILYNNTSSGQVEVHMFNPSLTQAIGYHDTPTPLSSFSPTQ